ncbi:MAG: 1-acyl-sn-glycerol-3-phosphate acyltransferase [Rhodobacteraceae bacterium]|nr:1-acyl-sn-glycerol-3-phosphate acyltransferase [Paracoccaceae bacterium]
MSTTWRGEEEPDHPRPKGVAWVRVAVKGGLLGLLTFGCLGLLLLVRLIEAPLFGLRRPVTPFITQFVCRNAFRILGMRFESDGEPMRSHGAVVANHSSWLDIFSLNARKRIYYVAKAEVAGWAGIGWLARATGTVFINRDPKEAAEQRALFIRRLAAGHKLLFFPEGTSTDGQRVLSFKPTLFAAFFDAELRDTIWVQPVSVTYYAPLGEEPRFYSWWGGMDFAPHLLKVLAAPRQGRVRVVYHPPLRVADYAGRKQLAAEAEVSVRRGHDAGVEAGRISPVR